MSSITGNSDNIFVNNANLKIVKPGRGIVFSDGTVFSTAPPNSDSGNTAYFSNGINAFIITETTANTGFAGNTAPTDAISVSSNLFISYTGNLITTGQITAGSVANVESNILSLETSNGLVWSNITTLKTDLSAVNSNLNTEITSNITALKTDLGLYESNIHLGGFNVGINPKNSFTPSANLHVVGNIFSSSNIDTSGPIGINSNHYIRELVSNATDRSLLIGFDGNTDRVRIGQGTGGKPIVNMYGGTSGSNKIETTFPIHLNNGVFSIIRDHPTTPTLATGLSLSFGSILPASNYLLNTGDVNFGASAYKWKDMYANAYFNFTGTHIAGNYLDIPDGSIVISTGNVESLSITETKAEIALCNVSKDKRVIGVTIKTVEIIENQDDIVSSGVIALGEGRMWVCNENGNIENGDYIYSSNVAGHGMKQDDDLLHNYTVAKATEDCSFTGPDDKKLISVTFHCG